MAKAQKFQGVVSRTSVKPWTGNDGNEITLHSFQLDSTGNRWFRTGTKLLVQQGTAVEFFADSQTNKVSEDTLIVSEDVPSSAPKAEVATRAPTVSRSYGGAGTRAGGASNSRDDYWANKEAKDVEKDKRYQEVDIPRMTFCTAQDAAVAIVAAAVAQDLLPAAGRNKADRFDTVLGYVDEVTDRFYRQRMARSVAGDDAVEVEEASSEDVEIE